MTKLTLFLAHGIVRCVYEIKMEFISKGKCLNYCNMKFDAPFE